MTYSFAIGADYLIPGVTASLNATTTVVCTAMMASYLTPGDYVTIAGETRLVNSVSEVIGLPAFTVTVAFTLTALVEPITRIRLSNLETGLRVPPPRAVFVPYSRLITLGDGSVRGAGWATAEWQWGFLKQTERDVLRAYCSGASATVIICTRTNDVADAYDTFQAVLVWPGAEDKRAGRRLDFILRFQAMQEIDDGL